MTLHSNFADSQDIVSGASHATMLKPASGFSTSGTFNGGIKGDCPLSNGTGAAENVKKSSC